MKSLPVIYQICISGLLDEQWSDCFNGMRIYTISGDPPMTILAGPVRDQAALRGILNKLWDLNLILCSLNRFEGKDDVVVVEGRLQEEENDC